MGKDIYLKSNLPWLDKEFSESCKEMNKLTYALKLIRSDILAMERKRNRKTRKGQKLNKKISENLNKSKDFRKLLNIMHD